ncbi:MAG TPA: phycobilisome rod-core linker polypeptide, partial [Longimicrobium sp.]|nr:phycobilisome rod-core linker polypeptide [Longimicrobium sp.]
MSITPDGGTFATADVPLTVEWEDDRAVKPGGVTVTVNGISATHLFTYTPGPDATSGTASGTVRLSPGSNTVAFVVLDQTENSTAQTVVLTYTPPPPAPAPLPRATNGAAPSRTDVVEGIYRLVVEREGDAAGMAHWVGQMNAGVTVKQLMRTFATGAEYQAKFVTGRSAEEVVAGVYRHVYAREAAPGEVSAWAPVAANQGWIAVVDGLLGDWSYAEWFGEHAVPGAPVTLWDAARAPLVLEPGSASANVDRGQCLTISAGSGAAYECGDLRLVHGLPAIRSLNKSRAPVLLYNSQHAAPTPTVAARVVLPADQGVPTRVDAILKVGPSWNQLTQRGPTRSWPGSQWTPGSARRIVLSFDASEDATGPREYALEIVATYPDGTTGRWVMRGNLAIVNRRSSPYGPGWWVAGVEQLQIADNRIFWVGGDGSTRLYRHRPQPDNWHVYVGETADRGRDTIRWNPYYHLTWTSNHAGGTYERRIPGGTSVFFDVNTGQQGATVNRLGQQTHFVYSGVRLDSLRLPTAGGSAPRPAYRFEYGGPGGTLSRVMAPDLNNVPGRPTVLYHQFGDGRVTAIIDPDGSEVRFDVSHYSAAPSRITMRRDRRGTDTHYGFDAGGKMAHIHTDMRGTGANITTYVAAQETRGLTGAPIEPMDAHTVLDGPRAGPIDVTRLWLDRFGAPWRILDALNNETVVTRSDPRFPALATRTDGPVRADGGRLTVSASYTARGNLEARTDWSTSEMRPVINPVNGFTTNQAVYATTRYGYEAAAWPDFPTRVTSPEGEVSRTEYLADGNRDWQQPGDDATRRVHFGYNARGLVQTVTQPVVNGSASAESFEYDNFGNLSATVGPATQAAPLGYRTVLHNDALGRTVRTESPLDSDPAHKQVTTTEFHSDTDRVWTTVTQAPLLYGSTPGALQTVKVENWYDPEGLPRRVDRTVNPDPSNLGIITLRWERDAAGRAIAEFAPDVTPLDSTDNPVDRTVYDAAGNVEEFRSRRRNPGSAAPLTTVMTYDALNRLRTRAIPEAR